MIKGYYRKGNQVAEICNQNGFITAIIKDVETKQTITALGGSNTNETLKHIEVLMG